MNNIEKIPSESALIPDALKGQICALFAKLTNPYAAVPTVSTINGDKKKFIHKVTPKDTIPAIKLIIKLAPFLFFVIYHRL